MNEPKGSFWLTPNGLAALGLIGAVLYFLLSEHRAHFIYALPYLILLLCPVMHMFMHRGHGDHGGHGHDGNHSQRENTPDELPLNEHRVVQDRRNKESE